MTKTTVTTKSQSVLVWHQTFQGSAYFTSEEDDDPTTFRGLTIPRGLWEEMGEPKVVTIVVKPGRQIR